MPATRLRHVPGMLLMIMLARCEPPPDCNLRMVVQVPLETSGRLPVVAAGINGKQVRLVVDTGAEKTTISAAAADRLGLLWNTPYTARSHGIGGSADTKQATIDPLVLGGKNFPIGRIDIGNFKSRKEADGFLGVDVLLAFDLDIDMPGGKLTLYHSRVCPYIERPWHRPWAEITGITPVKNRLQVPFTVDSVAGLALLDTGSEVNVLGPDMARRLGLTEAAMAGDAIFPISGAGPKVIDARWHRFQQLQIGPFVEQAVMIPVLDADLGGSEALIGQSFLRGRRVWMSLWNRQVFVSRRPNEP